MDNCFPLQSQDHSQGIIAETIKEHEVQSKIAHESLKGSASHLTKEQEEVRKKYNLNTWKYAELRDTINTSVGKSASVCICRTIVTVTYKCPLQFTGFNLYHKWLIKSNTRRCGLNSNYCEAALLSCVCVCVSTTSRSSMSCTTSFKLELHR